MPFYPIHPCCYCSDRPCSMVKKVECLQFLAYIQKLNSMNAQQVLIKELRYLISNKVPRPLDCARGSGQGGN